MNPTHKTPSQSTDAQHGGQRELSDLIAHLPGMAYRSLNDHPWSMQFVSKGCLSLTGYTAQQLLESDGGYAQLIEDDDHDTLWQQLQDAVHNKRDYQLEYRIRTKGGEEKWVREQGYGVFDEKGELQTLAGFITDISSQKREQNSNETNRALGFTGPRGK